MIHQSNTPLSPAPQSPVVGASQGMQPSSSTSPILIASRTIIATRMARWASHKLDMVLTALEADDVYPACRVWLLLQKRVLERLFVPAICREGR